MKIYLGIAPIAWSNDDMPELGGDTPIETCLNQASSAGFTGIELGGKFPRNPGIIKFLLSKYNLTLPGGWYGSKLREKNVEEEKIVKTAIHNETTTEYTVKKGDSLWLIARKFDIWVTDLLKWNNLKRNRPLQPGQILKINTEKNAN